MKPFSAEKRPLLAEMELKETFLNETYTAIHVNLPKEHLALSRKIPHSRTPAR